ncbi:MAG TPA: M48 family metallopeptidase [Vicinamibacterales bacterium]
MSVHPRACVAGAVIAAAVAVSVALGAQTVIKLPKNKFTPQQDVELGRQAAAEVRKQYPIIRDENIDSYLTRLGNRLVESAPSEFKQPVYEYSFTPVNLKEINAFALPGGPMFVHRGMFDAAASEGEVAGVMAHELSHVLLRHGTANMTKAQNPWLQLGQIAGAVGGAVVGGAAGSAITQGSQFGLGTVVMRYSRDFEKQADILGVQIMARAGYDPRALAHMFETIESQAKSSGGNGPQWLSDHPNPGNRSQYIDEEASHLSLGAPPDSTQFPTIKTAFAGLPKAMTTAELARAKNTGGGETGEMARSVGRPGDPVPRPTSQFHDISGGKVFQASVPSDWTSLASRTSMKVVPPNGYGDLKGQTVFTYGVEFGVAQSNSRDLHAATDTFLDAIARGNPGLQTGGDRQALRISQRSALLTPLVNPSALGGRERVDIYTTFLSDGSLFYYLTVVPEADAPAFADVFRRIAESIRLTDAR